MKILFIDENKASLPEIDAYTEYFRSKGIKCYREKTLDDFLEGKKEYPDVVWEFKGVAGVKKSKRYLLIHEYASLSTGKIPKTKNKLKKIINYVPDFRVFLNKAVKEEMSFNDNVPYIYRDMGVESTFIRNKYVVEEEKKYDYVYVGEISYSRKIDELLNNFCKSKNNYNLCLVGKFDNRIYKKYSNNSRVYFAGFVSRDKVMSYLSQSRVAINYIPDIYPYNIQTSTKLLEYVAFGIPVLSTEYYWVKQFDKKYKLNLTYLKTKSDFDIKQFNFQKNIPNHLVKKFEWNNILQDLNLYEIILKLIEEKKKSRGE